MAGTGMLVVPDCGRHGAHSDPKAMRLRPHHLIDIVTSFGHGQEFRPHPYGHALHTVAQAVLADPDVEAEFVIAADDVCRPCSHLTPEGLCDDIRVNRPPPLWKQEYNDDLDRRLLAHLHVNDGVCMTVREFLGSSRRTSRARWPSSRGTNRCAARACMASPKACASLASIDLCIPAGCCDQLGPTQYGHFRPRRPLDLAP